MLEKHKQYYTICKPILKELLKWNYTQIKGKLTGHQIIQRHTFNLSFHFDILNHIYHGNSGSLIRQTHTSF